MFAFVFEIIWTSIGFGWIDENNQICKTETDPLHSMAKALAVLAFVFLFGGIFLGCCTACINSCCGDSQDSGWGFGGSSKNRNRKDDPKYAPPPGVPIQNGAHGNNNIQPVEIQPKKQEESNWLSSVQKNFKWLGFGDSKPKPKPQQNNFAPMGNNQPQPPPMQNQLQQGQFTNVNQNPNPNMYGQPGYGGMNQQPGFAQPGPNAYGQQQFQQQPPIQQFGQNQPQGGYPVQQGGMVQQQPQYISEGNNQGNYNYPDQSQPQGYQPPIQEIQKQEPAPAPAKKGFVTSLKNFWAKATK